MALVIDTGPLYAAYDRSDEHHARCRRLLESTNEELIIPAPVIPEFDHLVWRRDIHGAALALMDDILAGAFTVAAVTVDDHVRCRELMQRYDSAEIGYVDSAVLALVERLKEPKLATLDLQHFHMLRPRHVPALVLLPD